eukprot:gene1938-3758_t
MIATIADTFTSLISRIRANQKPDPVKLAKKNRRAAVRRQAAIEKSELKLTIKIVFGDLKKVKRRDVHIIKDVTLRQIWMEELFIFNAIVKLKPEERFRTCDKYVLQWQPPESAFRQIIPLDNREVQEFAIKQIKSMKRKHRNKILFYFMTLDPLLTLFEPHIHPASLVSYRTKPEILNKLCEFYRESKLSLDDLNFIVNSDHHLWNKILYNLLPEDERIYHEHLNIDIDKYAKLPKLKLIEKQYIKGEITLKEYQDLKFPERKRLYDEEFNTKYPLPYELNTCILCSSPDGIIKCQNPSCSNVVCQQCIQNKFLNPDSDEGAFIFMHRRYCMKFGVRSTPVVTVIPEPAFLRELRSTGRESVQYLIPKVNINEKDGDSDDPNDEIGHGFDLREFEKEHQKEEEERHKKLQELELQRREEELMNNPIELQELYEKYKKLSHACSAISEEFLRYQKQFEEPGHNEHFKLRLIRLKNELSNKLVVHEDKLSKMFIELKALGINTKHVAIFESELRQQQKSVTALLNMKSFSHLQELNAAAQQEELAKIEFDVMNKLL